MYCHPVIYFYKICDHVVHDVIYFTAIRKIKSSSSEVDHKYLLLVIWEEHSTLELQNQKTPKTLKKSKTTNTKPCIHSGISISNNSTLSCTFIQNTYIFTSSWKKMWSFFMTPDSSGSILNRALKTQVSSKLYQECHQSTSELLFQCFFPCCYIRLPFDYEKFTYCWRFTTDTAFT